MAFSPYNFFRSLLFKIDAETAHHLGLYGLGLVHRFHLNRLLFGPSVNAPVTVMGLTFPNAVGLAAGLDKNGDHFASLGACGFGFVEIGTITPRSQPGNAQPRLFRLPEAQGIINRMGFNNLGVKHLVKQVKNTQFEGVLGINIGKNFDTPVENAADDYVLCLQQVYAYADYITVNISSPNTPGLRDLQFGDALSELLVKVKSEQKILAKQYDRYVPIAVKIAPDMDDKSIEWLAKMLIEHEMDAVIATNTTLSRDGVEGLEHADEAGGLSGVPVRDKADHVLQVMAVHLDGALPIIAAGGISCGEDAVRKIQLGAALVQIYSGFIYQGPELVHECAQALSNLSNKD